MRRRIAVVVAASIAALICTSSPSRSGRLSGTKLQPPPSRQRLPRLLRAGIRPRCRTHASDPQPSRAAAADEVRPAAAVRPRRQTLCDADRSRSHWQDVLRWKRDPLSDAIVARVGGRRVVSARHPEEHPGVPLQDADPRVHARLPLRHEPRLIRMERMVLRKASPSTRASSTRFRRTVRRSTTV